MISVIIISYNTRQMTLDCLAAISAELAGIESEIIVVDNGSADSSPAAIREKFPGVTLIENTENKGFGAANNQAMRASRGDLLLLINSDAFPKKGALAAMLQSLKDHPEAGVIGPRLLNADGSTQRSCFRFPSPLQAWLENLWITALASTDSPFGDYRRWPHNAERDVDFVIGAAMLLPRQVFEKTAGFDERFFMYCEEADWQKRIRQAGWTVHFTPTAQVTHLGGASGASEKQRVNRHFFDSLDYYQLKHHGRLGLLLFRLAMIVGCSVRAAGWLVRMITGPRRAIAQAKLRLRLWLVWRQATDWHIKFKPNGV